MGAIRGTTPVYVLILDGYDLTGTTVYVTLAQGEVKTTLPRERLSVAAEESGSVVAFELTQAETLGYKVGYVEVQVKCIDAEGNADGFAIGQFTISRALLEKEISYDAEDNH